MLDAIFQSLIMKIMPKGQFWTFPATFSQFKPASLSQLEEIISHMKPSGSPLDVLPPRLVKETIKAIGPNVLRIMNESLAGNVPANFKHAVVQPLI